MAHDGTRPRRRQPGRPRRERLRLARRRAGARRRRRARRLTPTWPRRGAAFGDGSCAAARRHVRPAVPRPQPRVPAELRDGAGARACAAPLVEHLALDELRGFVLHAGHGLRRPPTTSSATGRGRARAARRGQRAAARVGRRLGGDRHRLGGAAGRDARRRGRPRRGCAACSTARLLPRPAAARRGELARELRARARADGVARAPARLVVRRVAAGRARRAPRRARARARALGRARSTAATRRRASRASSGPTRCSSSSSRPATPCGRARPTVLHHYRAPSAACASATRPAACRAAAARRAPAPAAARPPPPPSSRGARYRAAAFAPRAPHGTPPLVPPRLRGLPPHCPTTGA